MAATLPPTASPSRPPLDPEEEDDILDECDHYSLTHSYIGKATRQLSDFSSSSSDLEFLSQIAPSN